MMPATHDHFRTNLIAAIILYAAVILYQGYQYGQSDQSQIIPVLYAQDHPDTYKTDHYVQTYLRSGTNERTIFHAFLRKAGYQSPWLVFFWHAIASIALILAWIKIAGLYIHNQGLQWLSISLILIVGFHTHTGSNELYYNQLVPSLPAKAIASWALFYWLKGKYTAWSILLILAGYLQPLVGLQLFIVTAGALLIDAIRNKNLKQLPWTQWLLYLILTLPWLYLLAIHNGGHENPGGYMDIIEFRLSHHFFGSYFGKIHLILGLLFSVIVILCHKDKLRWMFILIVTGIVAYEIGVEILGSPLFLYTQWWKTTIWVEAFALVTIISLAESQLGFLKKLERYKWALLVILLLSVSFYRLSGFFGARPEFLSPLTNYKSDEVDISEKANALSPENSVFIIPPDLSAFRWYSKRGTYIDYKAMNHSESFLQDWYTRMGEIYKYGIKEKKSGIPIFKQAHEILLNPTSDDIARWQSLGVTHLISFSSDLGGLQLLGQNETYAIYRLP